MVTVAASSPAVVTGLVNGSSYYFIVTARNSVGTSANSANSNTVVPTSAATAPGPPTGVTVVGGSASVAVSWTAPFNGGSAILDYTATSSPGGFTATSAASPATVTGLANGVAYTFTVTARNAIGVSLASAPSAPVTLSVQATTPGPPIGVGIINGDQRVTVVWLPPTNSGGSTILNYDVTSSAGATMTVNTTSAIFTGLANGTQYTFTVRARNALGLGTVSARSPVAVPNAVIGAGPGPGTPIAPIATGLRRSNSNWPGQTQVQLAIYSDPNNPSVPVDWSHSIDITKRVQGTWQARRGAPYELGRTETGEMVLPVDNRDGALDPDNADGPYLGLLLPYRPIRMLQSWGSVVYPVFTGYVERYPLTWEEGQFGLSTLLCVDALTFLASAALVDDVHAEIAVDAPLYSWAMDAAATGNDPVTGQSNPAGGQFVVNDGTPGPSWGSEMNFNVTGVGSTAGQVTTGASMLAPGDLGSSLAMITGTDPAGGNGGGYGLAQVAGLNIAGGVTVSFWMRCITTVGGALWRFNYYDFAANAGGPLVSLEVDELGFLYLLTWAGPGGSGAVGMTRQAFPGTGPVTDGAPHLITVNLSSTWQVLYVDTADQQGLAATIWTGLPPIQFLVGLNVDNLALLSWTIQHLTVDNGYLAPTRQISRYLARDGHADELTGARINRLLDHAHYSGPRAIDAGQSVEASYVTGTSALTVILDVATTDEMGTFYCAPDGTLTFKQRNARASAGTATFIFGEGIGYGEIPYEADIAAELDPTYIYNRVEITGPNMVVTQSFEDETSQRQYGHRLLSLSTNLAAAINDLAIRQRISNMVTVYKDPHQRIASLTFKPSNLRAADCPNAWPCALTVRRGMRVHVNKRTTPYLNMDCYVEHVQHNVNPDTMEWTVTLVLSPAYLATALNY